MSEVQAGWVDIELEDRDGQPVTVTMKPTPAAMVAISRRFGNMTNAMQAVLNRDVDAIINVAIQGAGLSQDKKAPARLEAQIFRTGLNDVAASCLKYLAVLQNGGKPLREDEIHDPGDPDADEEGNY